MGTVEYVEGFDDFNTFTELWTSSDSANQYVARPGRFGYGGYLWFNSHNSYCSKAVTADSEYTIACGWRPKSTSITTTLLQFMEGTTVHGQLEYVNGQFRVVSGANTWNADSVSVVANNWYHLEIDYKVADSPNGSVTLKINETTILNQTGVDTRNGQTGVIDLIRPISSNVTNAGSSWDDMVMMKGGGTVGDVRVITDYPIANGTNTDWTATSSSTIAWSTNGSLVPGSGNLTVIWPTTAVNDIGFLIIESAGDEFPTSTSEQNRYESSWNYLGYAKTGTGTAGTRLTVYWQRADRTAMPNVTVGDPGDHGAAIIVTVSGAYKVGNPIDAYTTGTKDSASTSLTITGPTTTYDGDLVLLIATSDLDSAAAWTSAWSNANLSSLTERYDYGFTDGNGGQIAVASGIKSTAGAVGDTTLTTSNGVNAFMAIAIRSKSASSAYDAVNDMMDNADTDYLSTSTAGDRSTFDFTDIGITGTVHSVTVAHASRKDDAGTRKVVTVIRDGSTNYDNATTQDLTDSYVHRQQTYVQDPSTSAAWTVSNVNSREYGIKLDT